MERVINISKMKHFPVNKFSKKRLEPENPKEEGREDSSSDEEEIVLEEIVTEEVPGWSRDTEQRTKDGTSTSQRTKFVPIRDRRDTVEGEVSLERTEYPIVVTPTSVREKPVDVEISPEMEQSSKHKMDQRNSSRGNTAEEVAQTPVEVMGEAQTQELPSEISGRDTSDSQIKEEAPVRRGTEEPKDKEEGRATRRPGLRPRSKLKRPDFLIYSIRNLEDSRPAMYLCEF